MTRVAIFASGNGSNAHQLAVYFNNHPSIQVTCVVSNRKQAGVFSKLAEFPGIEQVYVPKDNWNDEAQVLTILKEHQIDYIVLAGFLLKIPAFLIQAFPNKIINIHPALLPKFGGKGMYGMHVHEAVKAAGEKSSGITIHLVNEEFDKGEMLFQASCELKESDSAVDIATKVQALEHKHFAKEVEKQILRSC
jgi:phosphoribosylglycinamide formyltransferase-1